MDEAGDDGLHRSLRSADPKGASEWMVMSAMVLRVENDARTVAWLKDIIGKVGQHQITHLHFRQLKDDRKELVCRELASLPVRFFTVMSNKRNMRGYRNLNAEQARVNRTAWFFCWLSRLLLERVTHYCEYRSYMEHGGPRSVRVEFSAPGGADIDDVKLYFRYLSDQTKPGMIFNSLGNLAWSVVDVDQMSIHPNKMRAGLQLADGVASAFFQAVERTPAGIVKPRFAKLLLPRVCPRPMK